LAFTLKEAKDLTPSEMSKLTETLRAYEEEMNSLLEDQIFNTVD
jgi:hypothetical protein